MSNEKSVSVYERLWKLYIMVGKMIMDGVRDAEKVADALQAIVDEPVAVAKKYLRRLFETEKIVIGATDGTETFKSSGLFTGGIYGVSVPATVENPTSTQETTVAVHEMVEDGNYQTLFVSLGKAGEQEYEQSQIVAFCRVHPDKLRKDGYGTFFRLKGGFVAGVDVDDDGRLRVYVRPFSNDFVWYARFAHRLVAPQL